MRRTDREPWGSRLETSSRVSALRSIPARDRIGPRPLASRVSARDGSGQPPGAARSRVGRPQTASAISGVGYLDADALQADRETGESISGALDLDALHHGKAPRSAQSR